jgi:hypothetical protein
MAIVATAEGYGALEAQCVVLHMVAETSLATLLGTRHLALEFAEEVQRTEASACQAKHAGRATLHVSRPALAAEKQIAAEKIASDGLEQCLAL